MPIMKIFNPAAIRSHINECAKKSFFYDHENRWLCDGYTLIKIKHDAEVIMRERLLVLDRNINMRDGRMNSGDLPDFNAIIPKTLIEASMTPFVHHVPNSSYRKNIVKRVFKDIEGRKTACNEKYVNFCSDKITWYMAKPEGEDNDTAHRSMVGKYGDEVMIMILPVRIELNQLQL